MESMPAAIHIPPQAVFVIEPRSGWVPIDWRELWTYRELLGFLVWRDLKVRYKQTVLGAAWAILQPLMTMVVFTILFGRWANMPSDGLPYSLFAFAALIPWSFFANALAATSGSLVGSTHLISKVYFPRLLIPLSSLGTGLMDVVISLAVMLVMMPFYDVAITWQLLALPLMIVLTLAIAFGVGSAVSSLNVMYRDIRYVVPFLTQIWMFGSPVIYPVSLVPAEWRWAYYLNPMAGAIEGFRAALLGTPFNLPALGMSAIVTIVLLWIGLAYFRRVEGRIADFA
jgi:lipopolysaccharide transport system permease protein